MDCADRVDDRTFGVNFSSEGVAMLREGVNEKLKDFLGNYTDNILVEYVIVLLKNGRRKEEAKNELNVFLGDDSDCFVSWLWDHLGSNLHLYVQPQESHPDEAAKTKPRTGVQAGGNNSCRLDSDSERGKSNKLSGSRHNRDWKCLVRDADEPLPFQSFVADNADADGKTQRTIIPSKQSPSPQPIGQKKRSWPDEPKLTKRRVVSQATTGAPRRLLQFAVRDALATSRSSSSISEPALKRLRSVVSTSAGDLSVEGRRRRLDSVPRVPNAMITAIKAVEEAAKVVVKNRSTDNVFDRLGRGMDVPEANDQLAEFGEAAHKGMEYGELDEGLGEARTSYLRRSDYTGEYGGDMTTLETDTGMDSDSAVDTGRFTDANVTCRVMDISQTGSSGGNENQDPLMVCPNVAKNSDEMKPWKNQDLPDSVASNSRKIVNISVNVNTWKPPHYQEPTEVSEMDSRKSVLESEAGLGKSALLLMKDDSNPVSVSSGNRNGNATPAAAGQRDSQKSLPATPSLYSTSRPTEDADSRTIFVTNVHFAATKDSLSRHFIKFGEVLKVIIVTDAATGQPRGSAYVEFLRKDAAENALSLDGTSFMSRILKVVKKSSAQEAAPVMSWPHVVRGSMFPPPRFARVPFSRGFPSVYRARPPIKPGARSLQWKRDAQVAPSDSGASSGNSVSSPTVRSLTYVRTEPKTNGGSAIA